MALALPTIQIQKPKERVRVGTGRVMKDLPPPKKYTVNARKLPFNRFVAMPIINNIAYAGYANVPIRDFTVPYKEWELYDGLKAIALLDHAIDIVENSTTIIFEPKHNAGHQYFIILGTCAYYYRFDVMCVDDNNTAIEDARFKSLQWGKYWIIKTVKEHCYQGRILPQEEFFQVWKKALQKQNPHEDGDVPF